MSPLRARCEGAVGDRYGSGPKAVVWKRLDDELELIRGLGYASYFLTVGDVTDLIREMGVRCAARGSGAGSIVNYLLGVSGVDPVRHRLLMERFLSPLREALPDIDVDVESARRLEVYERILDRYGGERCVTVSMMDTYRVRHAVRDVGAALGMPPSETDAIAKAFPHIRARDARAALRELPELRASGLTDVRLDLMFQLVERLDGLPRHVAMHPCGVLLSDATLLDRTPVEASFAGFPMSQFDKDDVEDLGLLKLDVLGIRMQSSMAHAVAEIRRTDGIEIDLDDETQVPLDDPETYAVISSAKTLGMFQIESPGQRELVGKSGIDSFEEIITDISLFRPGPVKSDMITPYLEGKQGWKAPTYLHDDLRPILGDTQGVVVFHEQVIEMIAQFAGISFAEADEKRRALGDVDGMAETKVWFFPRALGRGYPLPLVEQGLEGARGVRVLRLLQGPRRGVRAADLPVRVAQDALAGALPGRRAHPRPGDVPQAADPRRRPPARAGGARPRRQRQREGLRRGAGGGRGRPASRRHQTGAGRGQGHQRGRGGADRRGPAVPLADRLLAPGPGVPADRRAAGAGRRVRRGLRHRHRRRGAPARPGDPPRPAAPGRRARPARARRRPGRHPVAGRRGLASRTSRSGSRAGSAARAKADDAAARNSSDHQVRDTVADLERHPLGDAGVWAQAAAQSKATAAAAAGRLGAADAGARRRAGRGRGLRAAGDDRRGADEGRAGDPRPRRQPPRRRLLRAVPRGARGGPQPRPAHPAQQVRAAGRRGQGRHPDPADPLRPPGHLPDPRRRDRPGRRDVLRGCPGSLRRHAVPLLAAGGARRAAPDRLPRRLAAGHRLLGAAGARLAVAAGRASTRCATQMAVVPEGFAGVGLVDAVPGAAESRSSRPVMARPPSFSPEGETDQQGAAGGMGRRRVLVHSSGFQMSPYADIKPAGEDTKDVARKLWHRSPGSPG